MILGWLIIMQVSGGLQWPINKLDGKFLNGKEHIKGKYYRNDENMFEGEFKNNILNGYGKKY